MLVLVAGWSGAGKDSLLGYAVSNFADEARVGSPAPCLLRGPPRDDPEPYEEHDASRTLAAATEQGRFALHLAGHTA